MNRLFKRFVKPASNSQDSNEEQEIEASNDQNKKQTKQQKPQQQETRRFRLRKGKDCEQIPLNGETNQPGPPSVDVNAVSPSDVPTTATAVQDVSSAARQVLVAQGTQAASANPPDTPVHAQATTVATLSLDSTLQGEEAAQPQMTTVYRVQEAKAQNVPIFKGPPEKWPLSSSQAPIQRLTVRPRQSSAFQIRNPETGEVLNSEASLAARSRPLSSSPRIDSRPLVPQVPVVSQTPLVQQVPKGPQVPLVPHYPQVPQVPQEQSRYTVSGPLQETSRGIVSRVQVEKLVTPRSSPTQGRVASSSLHYMQESVGDSSTSLVAQQAPSTLDLGSPLDSTTAVTMGQMAKCAQLLQQQRLVIRTSKPQAGRVIELPKRNFSIMSIASSRNMVQNRPLYPNQVIVPLHEQYMQGHHSRSRNRKITNVPSFFTHPLPQESPICCNHQEKLGVQKVYGINDLLRMAVASCAEFPEEAGHFLIVESGYTKRQQTPRSTSPQPIQRKSVERSGGGRASSNSNSKWRRESTLEIKREQIRPTIPKRELNPQEQFRREVTSLLNKLTVEKFLTVAEKLAVLYESLTTEQEVEEMVQLVHDKAVSELDYSDMYADLAFLLKYRFNNKLDVGYKFTCFHRTLLNRCQNSFVEINNEMADDESSNLSKRWVLGNIRFMGEMFLRKIITLTIIVQISRALVWIDPNEKPPSEHLAECFTELFTTIGYTLDQISGGREILDEYMGVLQRLKQANIYSVRINYRIQDLIDLRANNWQKKLFKEKATSVAQIHLEAQEEEMRGGTIHVQQQGKYTTAGLRVARHYTEYLTQQRQLAIAKTQNGVFVGPVQQGTGAPSGITTPSAVTPSSNATALSAANMGTSAQGEGGERDIVSLLVTHALENPSRSDFEQYWQELRPTSANATCICYKLCLKATYAKSISASAALTELAALVAMHLAPDPQECLNVISREFLIRLHDEILDNPRAVDIFAHLSSAIFMEASPANTSLLDRLALPQDKDTACDLCSKTVALLANQKTPLANARRILKKSLYNAFGKRVAAILD
ncbi:bifunctional Armadillo-type fold/MIF4G-like [Babesia duncani]|uniref:Bifunctional Armadillo-type fold/MIF4G-like n=1 Tax=Babesia duncani TaxID=323732 RepID=A0AAD9PN52_9APIC|nr:bifunctional Armadillo-type fold/MIF4G-like [Babesia duncani]